MNKINQVIAEVQQAQQTVMIALSTFLRNGGRDAAARLDGAIAEERKVLEKCCGDRHDYLAKTGR